MPEKIDCMKFEGVTPNGNVICDNEVTGFIKSFCGQFCSYRKPKPPRYPISVAVVERR
jgi:hypothetical protein